MTPSDADAASEPLGSVRCSARSKRSGQQCKRWATRGLTVCAMHGGSTKRAKAAAAKRLAVDEARRRLEIPANVDPRDALAEELARSVAWVRWLGTKVDAVDDTALIWGTTKTVDKPLMPETTDEAKPSMWWQLYVDERKRLVEVAKTAHACGVEDRRVQLAVRQAELLLQVVTGLVGELGHDMADPSTRRTVAGWLRRAESLEASGREIPGLQSPAPRGENGASS